MLCSQRFLRTKKGFTLMELLIVIAIIGLLGAAGMFGFLYQMKKTRDVKRKADIRMIQKALEVYFENNRFYPMTSSTWLGTCASYNTACGTNGSSLCTTTGTNGYVPNLAPDYISILPKDPKPSVKPPNIPCSSINQGCYIYQSDGSSYKIVSNCGIEATPWSSSDPFMDPARFGNPGWGIMACGGAFCDCTTNLGDPANACGW